MRAMFLNLETVFSIQNLQELIAWAISYQAKTHA